jgi:hypothetical protein
MKNKKTPETGIFKFFEEITEIVGWLQIVISSAILSFLVGCVVYACFQDVIGLVLGIAIIILGIIFGAFYATKKIKTTGTVDLLSKVSATPELDKLKSKAVLQDPDK